jgi:hydroxyethylthiazole kinase-like uncharacterized protein yjeF
MKAMKITFLKPLAKRTHKYSHGTVAVLAGSPEYSGAAVLTVGGARRGGAGYINFIYQDKLTRDLILSAYPDVVVRNSLRDVKADAWVVGPGSPKLGRRFAIPRTKYVVLDSNAMQYAKKVNAEFVVITPHEGEARELGFVIGEGDEGRRLSALAIAKEMNSVVVLKGFHTVVASPEGLVVLDELAGPELATAGSGDLLAGLIGSMLASWQPKSYSDVVEIVFRAISAHALAGKAAADVLRPVTAPDILLYLPRVLRQ